MRRADSLEKSLLMGKRGQEEKGVAEDEVVQEYHRLNGHEFEQTLGESGGQRAWCAAVYGAAKSRT